MRDSGAGTTTSPYGPITKRRSSRAGSVGTAISAAGQGGWAGASDGPPENFSR